MAENDGNGGQAAEETTASKDRDYGIFVELTADLKGSGDDLLKKIKENVAEEAKEAVILVRVGRAKAKDARGSLSAVAQLMDLNGDYQVIADGSRNDFKDVKSELKRTVSIG